VRLGRDRPVAHRTRGKSLDDLARGFDLFDWYPCRLVEPEREQAAQGGEPLVLLVDQTGVPLEDVISARVGGVLQAKHSLGIEQGILTVAPPLILAAVKEPRWPSVAQRERPMMVVHCLFGDLGYPDPPDPAGGLIEVPPDKIFVEPDRFEDLAAAI